MIRKFLNRLQKSDHVSMPLTSPEGFTYTPTWSINDFDDQRARIQNASAELQTVLLSVSAAGIGICHWQDAPVLNIQMPLPIARALRSCLNTSWVLDGSFDDSGEVTHWRLRLNSLALNHLSKDEAYAELRKRFNLIAHAFRIALHNQNAGVLSNESA